ncbi:MAG: TldD/PmbA family protein [Candidatus Micrarchaeia archaeon]|jgi:predicted Zn-dependent protease
MEFDAHRVLRIASRLCGECEVFATRTRGITAFLDSEKPDMAISSEESGFGLRVFKGKKVGTSSGSDFSNEGIRKVAMQALLSAKLNRENKGFEFPQQGRAAAGKDECDKSIAGIVLEGGDAASREARDFSKTLLAEGEGLQIPLASFNWSLVDYEIENTRGLHRRGKASFFAAEPYVIAKGKGKRSEVIEHRVLRKFPKNWSGEFAEECAGLAMQSLDARQLPSGEYDAILHPGEFAALFDETFGYMLTGRPRFDGLGLFSRGKKVMDNRISVQDAISIPGGAASFACDQEGVSRKPLSVVEKGVFKNELCDAFTAGLLKTKATGNCRREGHDYESWYASGPGCGFNNAVFNAGDRGLEELFGETKRGIYVVRTAYPLADAVSGKFTNEVRSGFFVENGEVKYPVKSVVVNGNFYDLMKNRVVGFSKERESVATSTDAFCSGVLAPHFKFSKVSVAGGAAKG